MIAKIIAHGSNRHEALARLHRALSQTTVLVRGGTTNKSFLLDLLAARRCAPARSTRRGSTGSPRPTSTCRRAWPTSPSSPPRSTPASSRRRSIAPRSSAGRAAAAPRPTPTIGREVELRHGGQSCRVTVRRVGPTRYEVELDGVTTVVEVERMGRARSRLTIGGRTFMVVSSTQGSDHLIEVDGVAHRFSRDDAGIVRAPAAALVVGVDVAPDDVVEAGSRLAVVEAMKMEIAISAPVSGRVRDVFVARNVQVDAGAPLFRIEPVGDDDAAMPVTDRIDLAALRADRAADDGLDLVRASVLGFDVTTAAALRLLDDDDRSGADALAILDAFADLCALAPERRDLDADTDETRAPRSTSTRTCDRSTSSARVCRSGSATGCCGRSPTTGWSGSTRAQRSRRRCCASSSPSSGARSSSRSWWPCSRARWRRPGCARRWTGSSSRPGGATRRSPAWPEASGTAASTVRSSIERGPRSRPR